MSAYDNAMEAAAYDYAYPHFERQEFIAMAAFTAVVDGLPLGSAPEAAIVHPLEADVTPEGFRQTSVPTTATYEVINLVEVSNEALAVSHNVGVQLMRATTTVIREELLGDGSNDETAIITRDSLYVLDTATEPPTLLQQYDRPPVTNVMGGEDNLDVVEQRIEPEQRPFTYEALLEAGPPQEQYLGMLMTAAALRGVNVEDYII
jgi:hypothetical protein